jgi:hypothetical protein
MEIRAGEGEAAGRYKLRRRTVSDGMESESYDMPGGQTDIERMMPTQFMNVARDSGEVRSADEMKPGEFSVEMPDSTIAARSAENERNARGARMVNDWMIGGKNPLSMELSQDQKRFAGEFTRGGPRTAGLTRQEQQRRWEAQRARGFAVEDRDKRMEHEQGLADKGYAAELAKAEAGRPADKGEPKVFNDASGNPAGVFYNGQMMGFAREKESWTGKEIKVDGKVVGHYDSDGRPHYLPRSKDGGKQDAGIPGDVWSLAK